MPNKDDYRKVADALRGQLGRKPFLTVSRREVTDLLREVSGEHRTRVKVLVAQAITDELARKGLNVYPALMDSDGKDLIRVFRSDSSLPDLIEVLNYPSPDNDARLRKALREVKVIAADENASSPGERELAAAS